MNQSARIAELEQALMECWGVMLLADLIVTDPKVKAAFARVDERCRATGLGPRPGMRFIDREPVAKELPESSERQLKGQP